MESLAVTVPRATTTPSNLRRRELCPGSARMEAGLPDEDSNEARAGRLFHRYWGNSNYDRSFLSPAERDLLDPFLLSRGAEVLVEPGGAIHENHVGAERPRRLFCRPLHPLVDFLDQTDQCVAVLTHEDESDQIVLASDRAQTFAGARSGHPIREKPAAIIPVANLRPGPQRLLGNEVARQQQNGASNAS